MVLESFLDDDTRLVLYLAIGGTGRDTAASNAVQVASWDEAEVGAGHVIERFFMFQEKMGEINKNLVNGCYDWFFGGYQNVFEYFGIFHCVDDVLIIYVTQPL